MAIHSSIFAWRIPWTGAWQAKVHEVAQSQTRLKQLHGFTLWKFFCEGKQSKISQLSLTTQCVYTHTHTHTHTQSWGILDDEAVGQQRKRAAEKKGHVDKGMQKLCRQAGGRTMSMLSLTLYQVRIFSLRNSLKNIVFVLKPNFNSEISRI